MAPRMPKERAAPVPAADEARSRVPPVVSAGAAKRAAGWVMKRTKRSPASALPKSTAQRLAVETT